MSLAPAQVVVIGGGCVGCSAAYHLARAGLTDVAVLERDYLGSGASGRCAGGMRQQWSAEGNVRLARLSIEAFARFEEEVGQDAEFVQGGYLLTAYTEEWAETLRAEIAVQNSCGVPTRFVGPEEVAEVAPMLSTEGMVGAAYGPTDGKANPFLVVKGYSERAREAGVRFLTGTEVTGLETSADAVTAVLTSRGRIAAEWVIDAAGGHAAAVAAMAGASVPVVPYRHQILVTEPVAPCHDPMVIDILHNIYFCQAQHGAFLIGQSDKDQPPGGDVSSGWRFPQEIARKMTMLAPRLGRLRVLRQWAGLYAVTPDSQPVIDRVGRYGNFLIAAGFSGHGFMLSPVSGRLLAEMVVEGRARTVDVSPFSLGRFDSGELAVEANVV
ncbi:MAG: NAD(P)/FAD-dependent oxidoreductase [Planctomycetota bacterium]